MKSLFFISLFFLTTVVKAQTASELFNEGKLKLDTKDFKGAIENLSNSILFTSNTLEKLNTK